LPFPREVGRNNGTNSPRCRTIWSPPNRLELVFFFCLATLRTVIAGRLLLCSHLLRPDPFLLTPLSCLLVLFCLSAAMFTPTPAPHLFSQQPQSTHALSVPARMGGYQSNVAATRDGPTPPDPGSLDPLEVHVLPGDMNDPTVLQLPLYPNGDSNYPSTVTPTASPTVMTTEIVVFNAHCHCVWRT